MRCYRYFPCFQVFSQSDISELSLEGIDNLLGLHNGAGGQQQAGTGGEVNEQMAIDAIQAQLMQEETIGVRTPSTMTTRPTMSSPVNITPNSQVGWGPTILLTIGGGFKTKWIFQVKFNFIYEFYEFFIFYTF